MLKSVNEFLHIKTVTEICHRNFKRNYERGGIKCAVSYSSDEDQYVPGYDDMNLLVLRHRLMTTLLRSLRRWSIRDPAS
jgi:hypothetical protein